MVRPARRTGAARAFEFVLLPMRSDFGPIDRVLFGMWLAEGAVAPTQPVRLRIDEIIVSPLAQALEDAPQAAPAPVEVAPAEDAPADPPATPPRRGHLRLVVSNDAPPQRRR
jgi:hypothetical protein